VTATPPKPNLVKTTALATAQAVTNRLNALLPTVPSAFSPTTVYQSGTDGVGAQLNAPTSVFPAGTGYYGVWTAPDLNSGRPYTVQVECFGGGGGGGGGSSTSGGAGGGGSEYAAEQAYPVKPGLSYAWAVGVPGSGGSANNDNNQSATAGGTGGTTVFDLAGTGIAGGVTAHGGTGGDAGNTGTAGAGGTGSNNSETFAGGPGGANVPGTGGGSGGQGGTDNPLTLNSSGLLSVPPNAWYVLDDASSNGQANDNSGNNLPASVSGIGGNSLVFAQAGAPSQVPGVTGAGSPPGAPNPTVAGTQVQFPLNAPAQASGYLFAPGTYFQGATVTIACWVTPDPTATWGNPVAGSRAVIASNCAAYAAGTNAAGAALYFKNGGTAAHPAWTVNWYCGNGTAGQVASHALAPVAGTPAYVVAVFSSGAMTLYVNGVSVATASAGFTNLPPAGAGLTLGISPALTSDWFFGFMANPWFAQGVLSASGVAQAYRGTGASSTSGGAGGGASGGPAAAGGAGSGGSGTAGGAGGTPASQPAADIGLTTPASAGVAGAASGSTNSGATPPPGAGGGGSGASATPPAVITVQVPFTTAATYCGTDAGAGAAQTVYNPVLQGTTGCLFAGGLPSDTASGSKNSLLILPSGLAASLKNGSYTVTRVTLTVTNAFPQAIQATLLEVGWAPDTSLPALYGAGDVAGSAGVVEIPPGSVTVTADLTESQLGLYLQNGTATALVLGPGTSPSFDAYNASTGGDFYNVIYGPGAADAAGNSRAPYLTITYAQAASVQQGSSGGAGAIRVTYLNPAQTLLGSWNPTQGIHAQGGQLTETSVVLGATTRDAAVFDRAVPEPVLEPTLLIPRGMRAGRRLGAIPGAPGAVFGYATGVTTVTQATPGNYTFTVPAGITSLSVVCWGGGAGTWGGNSGIGQGGGGGGGYAANPAYSVTPGQVISYTVGAGGTGSATNTGFTFASDGKNTVFDSTNVAGNGVVAAAGLSYLAQLNYAPGGGSPGAAGPGIGTVLFAGGNGGPLYSGQANGSGGGGSAGATGNGGGANYGGSPGTAGTGGGVNGGSGGPAPGGNGSAGPAPGGGGGGAAASNGSTTGGNGGNGKIIISYVNSTTLAHTLATAAGTDALGNAYQAGLTTTQATMGAGTVTGKLTASGGTSSSPSVVVTDTWQTASLANNWIGSGGVFGIRYRMATDQKIEIEGDIANSTLTGNSVATTLPTLYHPPTARNFPAGLNQAVSSNAASSPWVFVNTDGTVNVIGYELIGAEIFFQGYAPLT
jgi:hypothetical protein